MDLLLISARAVDGRPHPSRARAAALARALAADGHAVRWLCPAAPGEAPADGDVAADLAVSRPPTFRSVERRLSDPGLELRVSELVRARLPDVVHMLSFGGATSAFCAWIVNRLGAPLVISARFAEVFCHRGTLVDWQGRPCSEWQDPARCARCCLAASRDGLAPAVALLARACRLLGGFSPFPKEVEFVNRLELLLAGLLAAESVLVADEAEAERFAAAGVPRARIGIDCGDDAAGLARVYAGSIATRGT